MSIRANIETVKGKVAEACRRCGRGPGEVEIIAVTKTVDIQLIMEAIDNGITTVGENRVQEAWQKYQTIGQKASWHMIGHLQTNKVGRVLQFADLIQSVDSLHLAREIQRQAEKLRRVVAVLIQINTSGEETKFGFQPETASEAVEEIATLANIKVKGLMTIGAFLPDPEEVRPCFRMLRELRETIKTRIAGSVEMEVLSMGMTGDYEVAIEEGATMIRVGTAIFGSRG